MKAGFISPEQVLFDHGLGAFRPDEFIGEQEKALTKYIPYPAHNAKITIAQEDSLGLLFVRKTFGEGERKIPFQIAGGLCDDYALHERRLRDLGIRIAENYRLKIQRNGEYGTITVDQLFFPHGTLTDRLREGVNIERVITSSIRDTLIPVLACQKAGISDDESWVFLDSAPKNIAPVIKPDQEISVFYFDFFVPRVRNLDGSIKTYNNFNFHIRPEKEMRDRFFTKPGIINNFLQKAYIDLINLPDIWKIFSLVSFGEVQFYVEEYFPNKDIIDIAKTKYSRNGIGVK